MASHALSKARDIARRTRMRASSEIAKREHTMYATLASAVLGIAEAKGHPLPQVFGLDGTIVAGTAALLLADHSSSSTGRMLQSFADGMLAIGAYKMGRAVGGKSIGSLGDASDVAAIEAVLSAT
jgi:hypothetical protein